jgi:hypothetical protein
MFKKIVCSIALIVFIASASFAQTRTMYIGGVELRLGMPQETVMTLLSGKYTVASMGRSSFSVTQYDQKTKLYDMLGVVGFDGGQLSYISRDMDTSGWPNDEGYAVGRAIFDALNGSMPLTDNDGAKRARASMVVWSQDVSKPTPGTMRNINIYVDTQKIGIIIWDGADGKSVSASVSIQTKPW